MYKTVCPMGFGADAITEAAQLPVSRGPNRQVGSIVLNDKNGSHLRFKNP